MTDIPDALVEKAAQAAFWSDDFGGHHKPGLIPHAWDNIPEQGRRNYRDLARAVLEAVWGDVEALVYKAATEAGEAVRQEANQWWGKAMLNERLLWRTRRADAWDEGYEKRAETLGMTEDRNPYRGDGGD
jgi:hypothetical protein